MKPSLSVITSNLMGVFGLYNCGGCGHENSRYFLIIQNPIPSEILGWHKGFEISAFNNITKHRTPLYPEYAMVCGGNGSVKDDFQNSSTHIAQALKISKGLGLTVNIQDNIAHKNYIMLSNGKIIEDNYISHIK